MSESPLLRLPDEALLVILQDVQAVDNVRASATCKRLYTIANDSSLWRNYCLSAYSHWQDMRNFHKVTGKPPHNHDWKQTYVDRIARDKSSKSTFDNVIATQEARFRNIDIIAQTELEAREVLLPMLELPYTRPLGLAQSYWSSRVLRRVARRISIATLCSAAEGTSSLLAGMIAIDAMVLRAISTTFISEPTSESLNTVISLWKASELKDRPLKEQVMLIILYLRERGMVGNTDPSQYHALRNNFIHHATCEPVTPSSLPLQSNAIFNYVAKGLGITTHIVNFPGHIYSAVWRDSELDADGTDFRPADFFVDPWTHERILTTDDMHAQCRSRSIPLDLYSKCLGPASNRSLLLRAATNIINSFQFEIARQVSVDERYGRDYAEYAARWCTLIMTQGEAKAEQLNAVSGLVKRLFKEDSSILRDYVQDKFDSSYDHRPDLSSIMNESVESRSIIHDIAARRDGYITNPKIEARWKTKKQRVSDRMTASMTTPDGPRPIADQKLRENNTGVAYKIGQLFKHKRYEYIGVIIGWDVRCEAPDTWVQHMGVNQLPNGCEQSFYQIL